MAIALRLGRVVSGTGFVGMDATSRGDLASRADLALTEAAHATRDHRTRHSFPRIRVGSHARANRQRRSTVDKLTSSTSAHSSLVSPEKNLRRTTSALSGD